MSSFVTPASSQLELERQASTNHRRMSLEEPQYNQNQVEEYDKRDEASFADNEKQVPGPGAPGGPPKKYGLFEPGFKEGRSFLFKNVGSTILIVCAALLSILSIYWGTFYNRESRSVNLTAFVYNMDSPSSGEPVIGNALVQSLPPNTLGWEFKNETDVDLDAIKKEVHEQNCWIAVVVEKNATESYANAMENADGKFNSSGLIKVIYERERDLTTVMVYLPILLQVQDIFQGAASQAVLPALMSGLNDTQRADILRSAPQLLTSPLQFQMIDLSTYAPAILTAVLQVGLIYLIIISFFQFSLFGGLHQKLSPQLKPSGIFAYRFALPWICYFFFSLAITLVSLAFQVDFTITFGRAGFVVAWLTTYFAMLALGQFLENAAMLIIPLWPPGIAFLLLIMVVANISPAFSALELCPQFYRYGYALPVFNALEILRVILVGTTTRNLARSYCVILAWVVFNYACFPFCLKFFGQRMAAQKMKEVEDMKQQIMKQMGR